jgi:hypothetical protein
LPAQALLRAQALLLDQALLPAQALSLVLLATNVLRAMAMPQGGLGRQQRGHGPLRQAPTGSL